MDELQSNGQPVRCVPSRAVLSLHMTDSTRTSCSSIDLMAVSEDSTTTCKHNRQGARQRLGSFLPLMEASDVVYANRSEGT